MPTPKTTSSADINGRSQLKDLAAAFFSLFTSFGTLICCALPALLVSIGAGATLASLVSQFPQLIWLSAHKDYVFSMAAIMILMAAFMLWKNRNAPCPIDPKLARACRFGRKFSIVSLSLSTVILAIGAYFAYFLEKGA